MPNGKPAGIRCAQLSSDNRCLLFGDPRRPAVCASLKPTADMCGTDAADALDRLTRLERATQP